MEIRQLLKKDYKNYLYQATYKTHYYYDVELLENGFQLVLKDFTHNVTKTFEDRLFGDWLEEPIVFGAFENNQLVGLIEGSKETWHNLFRISNIFIFDHYRHRGIGTLLMNHMIDYVKSFHKYRGIILETQSCNYPAISFYKKCGFKLSRIDINEYTNEDVQNKEVRIDLILKL